MVSECCSLVQLELYWVDLAPSEKRDSLGSVPQYSTYLVITKIRSRRRSLAARRVLSSVRKREGAIVGIR